MQTLRPSRASWKGMQRHWADEMTVGVASKGRRRVSDCDRRRRANDTRLAYGRTGPDPSQCPHPTSTPSGFSARSASVSAISLTRVVGVSLHRAADFSLSTRAFRSAWMSVPQRSGAQCIRPGAADRSKPGINERADPRRGGSTAADRPPLGTWRPVVKADSPAACL